MRVTSRFSFLFCAICAVALLSAPRLALADFVSVDNGYLCYYTSDTSILGVGLEYPIRYLSYYYENESTGTSTYSTGNEFLYYGPGYSTSISISLDSPFTASIGWRFRSSIPTNTRFSIFTPSVFGITNAPSSVDASRPVLTFDRSEFTMAVYYCPAGYDTTLSSSYKYLAATTDGVTYSNGCYIVNEPIQAISVRFRTNRNLSYYTNVSTARFAPYWTELPQCYIDLGNGQMVSVLSYLNSIDSSLANFDSSSIVSAISDSTSSLLTRLLTVSGQITDNNSSATTRSINAANSNSAAEISAANSNSAAEISAIDSMSSSLMSRLLTVSGQITDNNSSATTRSINAANSNSAAEISATESQTDTMMSTSGSNNILSGQLSGASDSVNQGVFGQISSISDRFHYIYFNTGSVSSVSFPGISVLGYNLVPSQTVSLWQYGLEQFQEPVRMFCTFILFCAWFNGMVHIFQSQVLGLDLTSGADALSDFSGSSDRFRRLGR